MPIVPAICQDCRRAVPSTVEVHDGDHFPGGCYDGKCECGGELWVEAGVWGALCGALTCVGQCQNVPELQNLINIVESPDIEDSTAEEIAEQIREEAPTYAAFANTVPQDPGLRVQWIKFLAQSSRLLLQLANDSSFAGDVNAVMAGLIELYNEIYLWAKVRINKSGCLDQCEHGPTIVVYPEAIWYGFVKREDIEEIVQTHLIGGAPVQRLVLPEGCVNTPRCLHRGGGVQLGGV